MNPFRLRGPRWARPLLWLAELLSGLRSVGTVYDRLLAASATLSPQQFAQATVDAVGLRYQLKQGTLANIPASGPVLCVCNHPLGMADGVILPSLLLQQRPDLKVLVNDFLMRIDELRAIFIGVDVFNQQSSSNLRGMRAVHHHLAQGGALLMFPAGEVSSFDWSAKRIQDRPWHRFAAQLISRYQATVVPLHISGRNSGLFHVAGMLHPALRTALIPRQLANKKGKTIQVSIGQSIQPVELNRLADARQVISYLRLHSDLLSAQQPPNTKHLKNQSSEAPIAPPLVSDVMVHELADLPPSCVMVKRDALTAYVCRAQQIPHVLLAIGRLREINFRAVGEGTGQATDLDHYDDYYHHLFIWDHNKNVLVGAYRFGCVDEIVAQYGPAGLYTHSLFKFDQHFLKAMGPAIEMGRSVIDAPYQRNLAPLGLLWQGICTFVHRHPQYRVLFGPVSISNDYAPVTRQLMAAALKANHFDHLLSNLIQPRRPIEQQRLPWQKGAPEGIQCPQLLSKIVARHDNSGKGLPVMLRQYMQLNGRLVGFNVDPDFGNALDGMIVVDLLQVPEALLKRHMGAEAAQEYVRWQQRQSADASAGVTHAGC